MAHRDQMEDCTAMDLKDGDVTYLQGYRCRVSNVKHYPATETFSKLPVARYTLTNEPDELHSQRMHPAYDKQTYGGNRLYLTVREKSANN